MRGSGSALLAPALLLVLASSPSAATEFHVSPNGTHDTGAGTGTADTPWALETALRQPPSVQPGDTIWVHSGTYSGNYGSTLTGTSSAPIVVRVPPGERATLDGGSSPGPILEVGGAYAWYWGLEITSSDSNRGSGQSGPAASDVTRGEGVDTYQAPGVVGIKLINLVIHDTRQGVSLWKDAEDAELYGSLIYFNGWRGADNAHGHGVYVQNATGTKRIADNVVFRNFSHGLHGYSGDALLDGIHYVGNTVFSNGEPGGVFERNLLIGGGAAAHAPLWDANMTYTPPPAGVNALGLDGGCVDAVVTNNYLAGTSRALELYDCDSGLTMNGNTFFGVYETVGFGPGDHPENVYLSSKPDGQKVFVRKNEYEPGRANVTVYDWGGDPTVDVDLSGVLTRGASFEVRDAQSFFGTPVASGTYDGSAVRIPLTDLHPDAPRGMDTLPPTSPEFAVFVVLRTSGTPAAPASASGASGSGSAASSDTPSPAPAPAPAPAPSPAPPPSDGSTDDGTTLRNGKSFDPDAV
jgi:hypothetical protein